MLLHRTAVVRPLRAGCLAPRVPVADRYPQDRGLQTGERKAHGKNAGNLLGNLLCAVTNLLNGTGPVQQIADLLNQILGILNGL